jgi:hypothetical protein
MKVRDISGRLFLISLRSLRVVFEEARNRAGITNFHFHDLRRTFATMLIQNGVDLCKVKELLGHKTLAMTARYSHNCPESLRSSVEVWTLLQFYYTRCKCKLTGDAKASRIELRRSGGTGRRAGLKIRWSLALCGFKPRLRH